MAPRRDAGAAAVDPRRLIADATRRLIDGRESDPVSALRGAAHAFGIRDHARLPPVTAVIEAACAERRLFGGTAQAAALATLRRSAIEAMRFLAPFEPRLVGGVLDGWAGEGATVELQVFTDDDEALLLSLADLGIRPRVIRSRRVTGEGVSPRERLAFVAGGVPFELSVFRTCDLWRRTVAKGLGRATLAEVEALIELD
jgi:hypothetical protein